MDVLDREGKGDGVEVACRKRCSGLTKKRNDGMPEIKTVFEC